MYDYDLSLPRTLAECNGQDLAALAAGPIARGFGGSTVFLRYDDVVELLNHPNALTGGSQWLAAIGIRDGLFHEWFTNFLPLVDPPQHTRLRSLVGRAFAVRPIERLRPIVRKLADEALDALPPRGEFDVFAELGSRVPLRVILAMLGLHDVDLAELGLWLDDLAGAALAVELSPWVVARAERALERLYGFVDALLDERRAGADDNLIAALAQAEQDGSRLSRVELRAMVAGLLFAGSDTTRTLITVGTCLLAEHPRALAELQRSPELATSAVEEMLRIAAPAPQVYRFAMDRIERAGAVLEPGTPYTLSLAAANLDGAHFSQPARFDIRRSESPHLSFGRGRHFCLGAALARMEGQEVFRALATRAIRLELPGEAPRFVRATGLIRAAEPVRLRAVS